MRLLAKRLTRTICEEPRPDELVDSVAHPNAAVAAKLLHRCCDVIGERNLRAHTSMLSAPLAHHDGRKARTALRRPRR